MDDNTTCHRTLAVQNCLDSEGIQRLVRPARSPDLNPIENVWDASGSKLLVETILRQTRTPSSVHSHRNGINYLNSCWIILCKPDGRGYELVFSVRALVPPKFSVEEELMHVKHVDVKSPHVGVMWKFGRGVISSGIVLVT
ncbi:hypothetical protein TNCV_695991 [Trichonephila clavipes]|nr:hypothetical protein TNCV_695991 [Trichonephila clavipes]